MNFQAEIVQVDPSPIHVLIADDHSLTRFGLRSILERNADIKVVGEASTGSMAISLTDELHPHIVLLDIGMPDIDGIEVAARIKLDDQNIRIIMITAYEDELHVLAAMAAGADGYCIKNASSEQILSAVQSVSAGAVWLDRRIASIILNADTPVSSLKAETLGNSQNSNSKFGLTNRELEVLGLLVKGLANKEIADRLNVSIETIKTQMRHIMGKLSVADRTQAAVKAVREGFFA